MVQAYCSQLSNSSLSRTESQCSAGALITCGPGEKEPYGRGSLNGAGGAPIFRGIMPARGGGLRVLDARDTGMKKERRLGTCGERLSRTDDDICQTYTQRTHILGYGS